MVDREYKIITSIEAIETLDRVLGRINKCEKHLGRYWYAQCSGNMRLIKSFPYPNQYRAYKCDKCGIIREFWLQNGALCSDWG
jgi:hypothetical protein